MENYKPEEDSETVKLTKIWVKALACVLITFILAIITYNGYRTYRIGKAIEKGHNPVIARLAFTHGTYERLIYLSGNKYTQDQQNLLKAKKVKK